MRLLSTIIVDDQNTNIETLKGLLEKHCPSVNVIGTANNIESASALIIQKEPELLLLDIELNNRSGFDLLRMFPQSTFKTVFTTAYSEYAVDAFRAKALDYLLKPINFRYLQDAVNKVEMLIRNENIHHSITETTLLRHKVGLPTMEGVQYIDCNEIVHCDASGSYSIFYLSNGQRIMVSMRLKECEALLPDSIFFRVHHSHIVNVNYVDRYLKGKVSQVVLNTNTVIQLASSRKEDFLNFMKNKH